MLVRRKGRAVKAMDSNNRITSKAAGKARYCYGVKNVYGQGLLCRKESKRIKPNKCHETVNKVPC